MTAAPITLHVETHGDGPPLVVWHGWGMNLRVFAPLVARLAPHHRVIAVDLPGHGRSPWPAGVTDFAVLRDALLATVPHGSALLGWSMGATLALQAALARPGHVRALALLHATPRFVADPDWPHGLAPAVLADFARALDTDYARTVSDFLDLQVRGSRDAPTVLARLRAALHEQGDARPEALAAGLALLRQADLRAELAALDVPALVCSGQYDRVTPPAAAAALAALLPHARHRQFARAGHASFLSHTDEVADTLLDWLTGIAPTAPVVTSGTDSRTQASCA